MVPAAGTVRRMRALAAIGWAPAELAPNFGSREQVLQIRAGRTAMVTVLTASRVAAVYDRLSGTPGSSVRARNAARRAGWAPPLAWDGVDIDDPTAVPDLGDQGKGRGPAPRAHLDDVAHFAMYRMPAEQIAARLGVATPTVQDLLRKQKRDAA
jgi:hypothetical protein